MKMTLQSVYQQLRILQAHIPLSEESVPACVQEFKKLYQFVNNLNLSYNAGIALPESKFPYLTADFLHPANLSDTMLGLFNNEFQYAVQDLVTVIERIEKINQAGI